MQKTIVLPIQPHLKKWLQRRYFFKDELRVDSSTAIGITLIGLTKLKYQAKHTPEKFTDQITLVFNNCYSRCELRQSYVVQANTFIAKMFLEDMLTYIKAKDSEGVPAYRSIEHFLRDLRIDDGEFAKESAHRAFMRHRERIRNIGKPKNKLMKVS